jgi:hypothetical protein
MRKNHFFALVGPTYWQVVHLEFRKGALSLRAKGYYTPGKHAEFAGIDNLAKIYLRSNWAGGTIDMVGSKGNCPDCVERLGAEARELGVHIRTYIPCLPNVEEKERLIIKREPKEMIQEAIRRGTLGAVTLVTDRDFPAGASKVSVPTGPKLGGSISGAKTPGDGAPATAGGKTAKSAQVRMLPEEAKVAKGGTEGRRVAETERVSGTATRIYGGASSRPIEVTPSSGGGAAVGLAIPLIGAGLARIAGQNEVKKAEEEFNKVWPRIVSAMQASPETGVLVMFDFYPSAKAEGDIVREAQIFNVFEGIEFIQSRTMGEARLRSRTENAPLRPDDIQREYKWLPPIQPPKERADDTSQEGISRRVVALKEKIDGLQGRLNNLLVDSKRAEIFENADCPRLRDSEHVLDKPRVYQSSAKISIDQGRPNDALISIREGERLKRNVTALLDAYKFFDFEMYESLSLCLQLVP